MNSYKIEFEVRERSTYWTSVEANSPEEALKLWKDNSSDYDSEQEELLDSEDIVETAECVGVWEPDPDNNNFSGLKRYDEPIKLNE